MAEANPMADLPAGPAQRSPFEGHTPGDRANSGGKIGVRLSAGTLPCVLLIATWPSGIDAVSEALGAALEGIVVPAKTGETQQIPGGLLVRTGPEEFMLVASAGHLSVASLRQKIAADIGSVTDLSHARCRITITGEKSRDTLSKLFALDLREPEFPQGQVRLTGHHHVPCMLHRLGLERFDIYVFSTYAFDQLSTLIDAALEYGVGL